MCACRKIHVLARYSAYIRTTVYTYNSTAPVHKSMSTKDNTAPYKGKSDEHQVFVLAGQNRYDTGKTYVSTLGTLGQSQDRRNTSIQQEQVQDICSGKLSTWLSTTSPVLCTGMCLC